MKLCSNIIPKILPLDFYNHQLWLNEFQIKDTAG